MRTFATALRRFARDRRAASALEFALLAPFFLALMLSILEAGWLMTQTMMLDRGMDLAIRKLRIGTSVPLTQQTLKNWICEAAMVLPDCRNALMVELIRMDRPDDIPTSGAPCIDRQAVLNPVTQFDNAGRAETDFVRACYLVDPLMPTTGLGLQLPKDDTGAYHLVAASAFVNEP